MPRLHSKKPYLAFDLGAESGRAMLVSVQSGILTAQEIHRFKNQPIEAGGSLRWSVEALWREMRNALASLDGRELTSMGVSAWGVDYALLGQKGELLENPFHYRDSRTAGVMEEVFQRVTKEEIYARTGIQFMPINTLYQLFAACRQSPNLLATARQLLTIPDLFHYWLSGNAVSEFTNATTTQLVCPRTRTWSKELIGRLGLPTHLWSEIVEPGTFLGKLQSSVVPNSTLAGTPVIAPAAHDTGSAVAAIAASDGTAFLSSGTWSLIGSELDAPVITPLAMQLNFTNEGGVCGTTRLLKNVMGLWLLQSCQRAWGTRDYSELIQSAEREKSFRSLVDPDHESFLRPGDTPAAIDKFCSATEQPSPANAAAYVRAILESLAFKYRLVLSSLEKLIGRRIEQIRVIGGGSRNKLLNQLTADATGRKVLAGPTEATALGNAAVQILATSEATSLKEVRAMIERSFRIEVFEPVNTDHWDRHAARFEQYCEVAHA